MLKHTWYMEEKKTREIDLLGLVEKVYLCRVFNSSQLY